MLGDIVVVEGSKLKVVGVQLEGKDRELVLRGCLLELLYATKNDDAM